MCGISGFFSWRPKASESAEHEVMAMARALSHRGPDDHGIFVDLEGRLGLGHRRLSIIDLSPAGHQPMASADGRYTIIFNGEIYNYEALRAQLHVDGVKVAWRGHSDTEVAVEAIGRWGIRGAAKRFNGMFALAVWDRQERRLQLARDRSGVKPLYFGLSGGCFLFGSEARALAMHPAFDCQLNREVLGDFLAFGYLPNPESIYRNALNLAPGSILEVDCGAGAFDWNKLRELALTGRGRPFDLAVPGCRYQTYWSAHEVWMAGDRHPFRGSFAEAQQAAEELIRDSVRLRMLSDVPIGAFLSGGIDSSLVAAAMQQQSTRPIKTFTIGFVEDEFDESKYATEVAKHIGADHTNFILHEADCLRVARDFTDLQDEPLADSSFIPTYLVSRLARQHVTVALTGDGGDETFWGYWRYRDYQRLRLLYQLPSVARLPLVGLANLMRTAPVSRHRFKWYRYRVGKLLELCSGRDFFSAYYQSQMASGFDRVLSGPMRDVVAAKPHTQSQLMPDLGTRMTYADSVGYLPDDLHVKVDRASMKASLESREPLLDFRLVEFAAALPPAMKVSGPNGKIILREILYRHVPKAIIDRPKQGFAIPMERWLRGGLRNWAEGVLFQSHPATDELFHLPAIRQLWDAHQAGRANHKDLIWNILVLRGWLNNHKWS